MPLDSWPADLPTVHIVSSWSYSPAKGPDITSFEAGADLQREREGGGFDAPITRPFTAAQRRAFWNFWTVTLHGGSDFFEMPVYDPGNPEVPVKVCQIIGKPQEKEAGFDRFLITLQLRIY